MAVGIILIDHNEGKGWQITFVPGKGASCIVEVKDNIAYEKGMVYLDILFLYGLVLGEYTLYPLPITPIGSSGKVIIKACKGAIVRFLSMYITFHIVVLIFEW